MIIKKRNILVSIILSFVTCGIYAIVWEIKMIREAVSVKSPEEKGILEIILCILMPFLGWFLTEKKFAAGCEAQNILHKNRSVLYLLLSLTGIGIVITMALMQKSLNEIATVE